MPGCLLSESSNSVGILGTGGAGATGWPNGFLEPVWWVFTGWGSGDVVLPRGTEAERAGALKAEPADAGCANGDAMDGWLLVNEGKGFEDEAAAGDDAVGWAPRDI